MRVLGIVGSPRKGGNTEVLVREVTDAAASLGAEVEVVLLAELDVRPCDGCDSCLDTGRCVQEDDMQELYVKIEVADALVLGSPVYWWGPTAQFKAFIDRFYSIPEEKLKGKRVVIVTPFGDSDPAVSRHLRGMLRDALAYREMELVGVVNAPGVNDRGEVSSKRRIMGRARAMGKDLVLTGN